MDLKKFSGILMRTVAVLLILVMMSTALAAGRFARYTSSASGSDTARVAKFSVTEEGTLLHAFTVSMGPGDAPETGSVTVKNDSEVTIDYTISASMLYGFLPLQFTVDGASVPFTGTLASGDTATYKFKVSWPISENDSSYAGKVDCVNITLITAQKD